jgi:serine/threonine protein kinase
MLPSDRRAADAPTIIRSDGTAPHPPFTPSYIPGQKIGPFELIEPVGTGGMATVWKAFDREMSRDVALKILPADLARDPDHVARFKLEAQSAAALDHPCIAKAFQCGEWDGVHAIAFEYVPGETLRQRLEASGPIPPTDAVKYLRDLAAGLGHAAGRGVVHRDVKPANIVITPCGSAKLIDMGLARRQDAIAANGGLTTSGVTLGTFDYLSPEQALDPRRADVRSDLYSLGCTFYHVLTGRPPVPDGTAARKLHFHQHELPPDPRALNPAIPDDLAAVLSRLMMKQPEDRYQSPAELTHDLELIAAGLADPSQGSSSRIVTVPARPSGQWLVAAVAIAACLVIAVSMLSGGSTNRDQTFNPPVIPKAPGPVPDGPVIPAATSVVTADGFHLASNAEELATLLRAGTAAIRLEPGREYDLTLADPIVFTGEKLELETATDRPPAVLILPATAADALHSGTPTFRSSLSVELRRLVVRTVPTPFEEGPVIEPCGLLFDRTAKVILTACRFETNELLRTGKSASVAILADPSTELLVRNCTFPIGSIAVRLTGDVKASISETAFGPHESAFDLNAGRGTLLLRHCSFLFRPDGGAVFDLLDDPSYAITLSHNLFAAAGPLASPMMMMGQRDTPVLVRTASARSSSRITTQSGEPNAYYRIEAAAFAETVLPFDRRSEIGIDDPSATALTVVPWSETDPLVSLSDSTDPWRAFRARLDLPTLRIPKDVIVGVRHRTPDGMQRIYPGDWPPPRPADLTAGSIKLWWPAAPSSEPLPRNAARRLDELLAVARPGDTIEIRHTGKLPIRPVRLNTPNLNLTIRAAEGFRPILVPDPSSRLPDASLFELVEGELTFDGLDFQLSGRRDAADPRLLACVRLAGGAACSFRRCIVTLDEMDDKAAAVVLAGPESEMMRMSGGAAPPRVKWEDCLIRGTGRGLWVQAARPFALELTNTVIAMDGAYLMIDAPTRDLAGTARGKLSLTRLTAALAGPFIEMRAGRGTNGKPSLLPLDVETSRCLFAAVGTPRPLVVIDGGDPAESPDQYLVWQSDPPARYLNWERSGTMLEVRPADPSGGMTMLQLDLDDWLRRVTKEPSRSLSRNRPSRFPTSPRALADITAADVAVGRRGEPFAPTDSAGADPNAVPKPVE